MVQLIELVGNRNLVKIIVFFIKNPSIELSQTETIRKIKIAKATLIKWINFLLNKDIVNVKKIGNLKIYKLNRDNIIVKYLKILDNITELEKLKDLAIKYDLNIFLYGSAARGEDNEDSDIDILIIGKIKKEKIIGNISNISKKINKTIKFQIFSPLEWSKISKMDKAFYERVEKDKIQLT
jgi:predicted nucleotidyltransferase